MSNIIRQVGSGKTFLSPTDFYVQVNTSGVGEVELVLPNITSIFSNINTSLYQYIGIRFVDSTSNASVNNIVLTAFDGQTINGETQVRLNTNGVGGLLTLIGGTQWSFNQNTTSSGGSSKYKTQQLPTSYVPQLNQTEDLLDVAFQNNWWGLLINSYPLIRLNNGNVANVQYCQSVLYDGTLIFEAYDLETLDPKNGYWIAFQVNPLDKEELIKVGEVEMTQQFWDNWYDYTYKDPAITNEMSFVTSTYPSADTNLAESYITKLTYSNGVLTATDTFLDFGGVNYLQMFNNLTGLGAGSLTLSFSTPEYIADDDYYGMGYGSQSGWVYFMAQEGNYFENLCSYNVLTGETRFIDVLSALSSLTNWSSFNPISNSNIYNNWSHSKGILFQLDDGYVTSNGESTQGVTSVWSPYWDDNTKVVYITSRNADDGTYSSTGGAISNNITALNYNWYWDNDNIYIFAKYFDGATNSNGIYSYTFKLDVQEEPILRIYPSLTTYTIISSFAFNKGCLFQFLDFTQYYGRNYYYYFKSGELNPFIIQSNASYTTNMIDDKFYQTWGISRNLGKLGIYLDEYDSINFSN